MVILIFGLTEIDLLIILLISTIFLGDAVGNMSLIQMTSSILIFEACAYNSLLDDVIGLYLFDMARSGDRVDLGALGITGVKHNETY